ncbi:NAD-dependent epimerase/dehydratase family protein [bacterium]|nr:NAD-dependent epimerase/dehydratase family protein [bacterium]
MLKILVTGAAGFVGSHVAQRCLELGMEVVATDDLSGGFQENVPEKATWVQGDIQDDLFVKSLWGKYGPFDYVYHIAAYAAEGLSHFIRRYNYMNNLVASINLLNASVKNNVKCFIFTSSIAVYGTNQLPMTEDLIPQPEDPYGISKYAVELDLKAAYEMFGLNYVIFRPHNVYGEKQNISDKYRNVIGIFMNQVLHKKPMTIFGDGEQTRAFSYIDDVAPIIAKAPQVQEAYQKTFNIGADTPYSVVTLAEEVAKAFEVECQVQHLDARNEVVHAFADHSQVRKIFTSNREPISLAEGIGRMAAWVKARGPMLPVTYDNIEIVKNLPPSWRPK